tara:strand:- start:11 stop:691 length:681 start_codon:yes stop_codon:yes gene_type:complete
VLAKLSLLFPIGDGVETAAQQQLSTQLSTRAAAAEYRLLLGTMLGLAWTHSTPPFVTRSTIFCRTQVSMRRASVACTAGGLLEDARFAVRVSSEAKGLGLFANVWIDEDVYLFDYSGEVVSESDYDGSSAYAVGVEDAAGCSFVVDAADATVSSVARYMNHAASGAAECNCVLTEQGALAVDMAPSGLPRLLMYTTRAIEAGSELCWDYGEPYWAEVAHLGRFRAP